MKRVVQMVKDKNIAWHAGKSRWKEFKNLNTYSIGIELVNKGHHLDIKTLVKNRLKV